MNSESPQKIEAPVLAGASKGEPNMNADERNAVMPETPPSEASEVSMSTITPADKENIDLDLKPEHFEKLSREHQQILLARAIPIEYALRYGLHSIDCGKEKEVRKKYNLNEKYPRLPMYNGATGILIPYPDCEDGIPRARIRVDKGQIERDDGTVKKLRYVAQSDIPVAPFVTHEVQDIAGDASKDIYIVEAPLKAMAMSAAAFPSVGLGGVSAGLHDSEIKRETGEIVASKDWKRINCKGRKIVLVYDAMVTEKPMVALGAAMSAIALAKEGADVWFAFLPLYTPHGSDPENGKFWRAEDQGPDDFLARNGREAMQRIIDAAVPAEPDRRIATTSDMKALLGDLTFQAMLHLGGTRYEDDAVAALKKAKHGYRPKVVADAVKEFREAITAKAKESSSEKEDAPYVIEGARICMNTQEGPVPLTNFHARIVSDVTHNDGTEENLYFAIEGGLPGGYEFPRIEVSSTEFSKMEWVVGKWGSDAIIHVGPKFADRTREAIQTLSKDKKTKETIYGHVGWRIIDNAPVFLHEGLGSVRLTKQSENVRRDNRAAYQLPEQAENVVEAVRTSVLLLFLGSPHVTVPALAAHYRAPLSEFLAPDFALWFGGPSGSGKSSVQGHFMRHWGRNWKYNKLKLSWDSTKNSLELSLNLHKDVVSVIDNYVPGDSERTNDALVSKCTDIIKSLGDQSSRGRLNKDSTAKADRPPMGMVVMTGEDVPRGVSTLGRTYFVPVEPGDVDIKSIILYDENKARLLPHAMKAYVDWIAANWDRLREEIPAAHTRLQLEYQETNLISHSRDASNVANLEIGFHTFLEFALEIGALNPVEVEQLKKDVRAALRYNLGEKAVQAKQANPMNIIVEALRDGIASRKVHVGKADETLPAASNGEVSLGWDEGTKYVYVLRSALTAAIKNHIRTTGTRMEIKSEYQLCKELALAGILESDTVQRVSVGGYRPWVLRMNRSHLEDVLDAAASMQTQAHDQLQRDMDEAVNAEEIGKMLKRAHTAEQKPN